LELHHARKRLGGQRYRRPGPAVRSRGRRQPDRLPTGDGGTYETLGIENANYNVYGVDADGTDDVTVSGGGGSVYGWNGAQWVRDDTGDAGLRDVEEYGAGTLTVGGGGKLYREVDGTWSQEATPTSQNLTAVVSGVVEAAVGASGTVIENH
jgi:hypothetical protein